MVVSFPRPWGSHPHPAPPMSSLILRLLFHLSSVAHLCHPEPRRRISPLFRFGEISHSPGDRSGKKGCEAEWGAFGLTDLSGRSRVRDHWLFPARPLDRSVVWNSLQNGVSGGHGRGVTGDFTLLPVPPASTNTLPVIECRKPKSLAPLRWRPFEPFRRVQVFASA
jgi:hypothetical protein